MHGRRQDGIQLLHVDVVTSVDHEELIGRLSPRVLTRRWWALMDNSPVDYTCRCRLVEFSAQFDVNA